MDFQIRLAGKNIEISSCYDTLKTFCGAYVTDGQDSADFRIVLEEKDIFAEQPGEEKANYSMQYLETLAALRKISEKLPGYDRMLVHGACISFDGRGYVFTAPSGTGKSTHIALWKKYFGEHVSIINGDKPILSVEEAAGTTKVFAYGTPWAGKERWQRNSSVPLFGCCVLKRGEKNRIRRMLPQECAAYLLQQIYIPKNKEAAGRTLELLDKLLLEIPVYLLECDISEEAVRCSFEGMTGLEYGRFAKQITEK